MRETTKTELRGCALIIMRPSWPSPLVLDMRQIVGMSAVIDPDSGEFMPGIAISLTTSESPLEITSETMEEASSYVKRVTDAYISFLERQS